MKNLKMLRIKGLFIKEIKIHGGFIKFFLIILMFSFLISLISSFSIIVEYNEIMDTKIYKQIFPDDNNTIEEPELDSIETNKSIKEKLNNIDIKWFDSFKLLITIMSSFIVLFSSSSIYSDEYESGNIKIILSSPLSINEIKISKFLYSLLLTIMPVLLSVIIYIITLLILIHTFSYVYLIYTLITILLIIPIYIIYAHFISSIFNENVYPSVIILFSLLISNFIYILSIQYNFLSYFTIEKNVEIFLLYFFKFDYIKEINLLNFLISIFIFLFVIIFLNFMLHLMIKIKDA